MNQSVRFIRNNWLAISMVLIPSGLFLGPMPYSSVLYYILLTFLSLLSIVKQQGVSGSAVIFIIVCALSILLGNPSPIFNSWMRWGLFVLLLTAYFPVFRSNYFDNLRGRAFHLMLILLGFTSVGSFIAYFWGINYMTKAYGTFADSVAVDSTGWFGGLTYHSMMLGPICAIALTFFVWMMIEKMKTTRMKWIVGILAFMTFCCMMLTASRSANAAGIIGVIIVLFLNYRMRLRKVAQIAIIIVVGIFALNPIYMPYADKVISKQMNNSASGSTFASRSDRWEHRIEEFSEYPVFGYGFVAIDTKNIGEYMPSTGIIEPGSSWLAILSMTGIAGMACFLTMFLPTCSRLYNLFRYDDDKLALLHLAILAVFSIHFMAEGYVFSGGGALCFLFWFFFGCAYSYARDAITYSLITSEITMIR